MSDGWGSWVGGVAGAGGGGSGGGGNIGSYRVVDDLLADLAGASAGDWAELESAAGGSVAGLWVADGAGASFCVFLDFRLCDGNEFTIGDLGGENIELDSMPTAPTFGASGITPDPGTETRLILNCCGNFPRNLSFGITGRTSQSVSAGLAGGDWWGVGVDFERASDSAQLIGAGGVQYDGASWLPRVVYSVWPGVAFAGGSAFGAFDTNTVIDYSRNAQGGTGSSRMLGGVVGDTQGEGAGSLAFTLADGWNVAGDQVPCLFYSPGASDLEVSFESISIQLGDTP